MTEVPHIPADCLKHCRYAMLEAEYDLALKKIDILLTQAREAATAVAIEKCRVLVQAALDAPLVEPREERQ